MIKQLVKDIELYGTFTGSRYWDCDNQDSDYDYFMSKQNYIRIIKRIKDLQLEYKDAEYKSGIYINLDNKEFNLFVLDTEKLNVWSLANTTMKSISNNVSLKVSLENRDIRVDLFQTLCLFYNQNRHNHILNINYQNSLK